MSEIPTTTVDFCLMADFRDRLVAHRAEFGSDCCWLWGGRIDRGGYGRVGCSKLAHRAAYKLLVGPIPSGMVLDHLCRTRACINPSHLEPVTDWVNRARGERSPLSPTCVNGHLYTVENTYTYRGKRQCRTCRREASRRHEERTRRARELGVAS